MEKRWEVRWEKKGEKRGVRCRRGRVGVCCISVTPAISGGRECVDRPLHPHSSTLIVAALHPLLPPLYSTTSIHFIHQHLSLPLPWFHFIHLGTISPFIHLSICYPLPFLFTPYFHYFHPLHPSTFLSLCLSPDSTSFICVIYLRIQFCYFVY